MEIKQLQERIEKKQLQIAKIEKRIAKISKKLSNEKIDFVYRTMNLTYREIREKGLNLSFEQEDLRRAYQEYYESKNTLKKYQESLAIEINKENAPKIQVLVDFLNQWKDKANEFYHAEAIRLYEAYNEHKLRNETIKLIQDLKVRREENEKEYWRYHEVEKSYSPLLRKIRTYKEPYLYEGELEKELNNEVKHKYEDLVYRMKDVVGEIEDCSALRVGYNGSINGIIKGSKGNAKVETIYAGGYHIQRLHYRVLVNKIH